MSFDIIFITAVPLSKMEFATIRPRHRRHILNDTSVSFTIHDVRREIMRQLEKLMPLKYCKASERSVLQVPPDSLVPLGQKDHEAGGDKGERKGSKVPWDQLENPKKQE